jgi:hypothetical protein
MQCYIAMNGYKRKILNKIINLYNQARECKEWNKYLVILHHTD